MRAICMSNTMKEGHLRKMLVVQWSFVCSDAKNGNVGMSWGLVCGSAGRKRTLFVLLCKLYCSRMMVHIFSCVVDRFVLNIDYYMLF